MTGEKAPRGAPTLEILAGVVGGQLKVALAIGYLPTLLMLDLNLAYEDIGHLAYSEIRNFIFQLDVEFTSRPSRPHVAQIITKGIHIGPLSGTKPITLRSVIRIAEILRH